MKRIILLLAFLIIKNSLSAQSMYTNIYTCQDTAFPSVSIVDVKASTFGSRVVTLLNNGFLAPSRVALCDLDSIGNITVLNTVNTNASSIYVKAIITPDGGCFIGAGPSIDGKNIFIKLDSLGNIVWEKVLQAPQPIQVRYVSYNIRGNDTILYAGGIYFPGLTDNLRDSWMASFDTQGHLIKMKEIGDGVVPIVHGWENPSSGNPTSDGGMLVNCTLLSSSSASQYYYITYKVDAQLNLLWAKRYAPYSLYNNYCNATLELPGGSGYLTTVHSAGSGIYKTYFIRTDTLGELISYQILPGYLRVSGMQLLNDSVIYCGGITNNGYATIKGDTSGLITSMSFMKSDTSSFFANNLTYEFNKNKFLFWGTKCIAELDSMGSGLCQIDTVPNPSTSVSSLAVFNYPAIAVDLPTVLNDTILESGPTIITFVSACITTSVPILENVNTLKVYPNPAHSAINILGIQGTSKYYLYCLDGRKIDEGVISESINTIAIKSLNAGMYLLKIGEQTVKVFIE
jgi:Secretion system C-terminal sorting domain